MSAHDTLLRHCGSPSTAALALRTVWNPSRFSDWLSLCRHSSSPFEFTIMIDASQPCTHAHQPDRRSNGGSVDDLCADICSHQLDDSVRVRTLTAQSWKKSLSAAGAEIGDCAMDCFTELRTMTSRFGQMLE